MSTETSLVFKDFIPLIGTVLTLGAGYIFLTVQVRKNRRAKWIEDFRREAAKLTSIYSKGTEAEYRELHASAMMMYMYLDKGDKSHQKLVLLISSFMGSHAKETNPKKISDIIIEIMRECRIIIEKKQSKI